VGECDAECKGLEGTTITISNEFGADALACTFADDGLADYYHQVDTMQRELVWRTKYTLGPHSSLPRQVSD
jgi:hypothetical protein